ncbi:MAG: S1/P1 nuclease [Sphingobium sp.]
MLPISIRIFTIGLFFIGWCYPLNALAWGKTGHAIIADVAERRLRPTVLIQVQRLLRSENARKLSDISFWADHERAKVRSGSSEVLMPSHAARLPLNNSAHMGDISCGGEKMCAIDGINYYIARLKDRSLSDEERAVALNILVHLIGDVHQPFHGSIDNGGRRAYFNRVATTLHVIWDDNIIDARGYSYASILKDVERSSVGVRGSLLTWVVESRDIVRTRILPDFDKYGIAMSKKYATRNWPVVRLRLKQAGLRLSMILNECMS